MFPPRSPKLTDEQRARRRARWAATEAVGDLMVLGWAVRQIDTLPAAARDGAVEGLRRAIAVVDHVSALLDPVRPNVPAADTGSQNDATSPAADPRTSDSAREATGLQAPDMASASSPLPRPTTPDGLDISGASASPLVGGDLAALLASREAEELIALTAPPPVDLPWASEIEVATARILDALWAHPTHGEVAREVAQADLEQLAGLVCGSRTRARQWLSGANRILGGRAPADVARESAAGLARVRRLLLRSMLEAAAATARAAHPLASPPVPVPAAEALVAGAPGRWTCPACGAERPMRRGRSRSTLICRCRRAGVEWDPSSGVLREIVFAPGDPDLPRSGRRS